MQFKLQGAGTHVIAREKLNQQKSLLAVAWQVKQQLR